MGVPRRYLVIAGIVVSAVIGVITAVMLSSALQGGAPPQVRGDTMTRLIAPSIPSAPALGSDDAKITIVEFGDYRCAHCARFNTETKDLLMANYVETGKARFMFKDFTVNDSPSDRSSSLAAQSSYCAADQDKYWEFHDRLFAYTDAGSSAGQLTVDVLAGLAADAGIDDLGMFSQCVDSRKYSATVDGNNELAKNLGLQGTPSFLILSESDSPVLITGAQGFEVFSEVLEKIIDGDV